MDLAKKKLGVLLSTGPEHPNLDVALGLGKAALSRGAKLFVCAYGCQKRRIPLEDDPAITYCGLVVLTDLINGTDRFIALN